MCMMPAGQDDTAPRVPQPFHSPYKSDINKAASPATLHSLGTRSGADRSSSSCQGGRLIMAVFDPSYGHNNVL